MHNKLLVAAIATSIVACSVAPAVAYSTPPIWLSGDASNSQEWTVTSLTDQLTVGELNATNSLTGDSFTEGLYALDIDYSGSGNVAYGIGIGSENFYAIDLDENTLDLVWEDLGGTGENEIKNLAMHGNVAYVTYVNPANGNYAVGTIDNSTGDIDFLYDIEPHLTPRSLGYFDGDLFIIDGGYGLEEEYVLRSLDLETGDLTPLYTWDSSVYFIHDGDIDNNGLFRSLATITGTNVSLDFDLMTNAATINQLPGNYDGNLIAFWGTPNEIIATRYPNDSESLAPTGAVSLVAAVSVAIAALVSGAALRVKRRRSQF
jgi:hypothetical protein